MFNRRLEGADFDESTMLDRGCHSFETALE
jgi:hypothetical protein